MPINKKRYPPDWDDRSKRIKARDNYTCRQCGVKQGEEGAHDMMGKWFISREIYAMDDSARRLIFGSSLVATREPVLTAAHLDHDETNWDVSDDRLATLCDACHLRYDAVDNAIRRKYGRRYKDDQLVLAWEEEED